MKVFRWILSHLLLLVLVWTAVYIYLDWDNFREQLPVAVTDWIDNLSTRGVTTTQEPPVAIVTEEPIVIPPPQGQDAPATEEVEQPMATGTQEAPEEQPVVATEQPAQMPEVVAKQDDQAAAASEAVPVVEKPEPTAGSEPVAQPHELAGEEKALLVQAREAFWRRDLAKAEELYTQLAEVEPGNPDLWGELGNLYFSQNKIEQASDAYYKAAEILIEEGRFRQVHSLMGIIGNVDQEKARKLFDKMQGLYPQQPMYMR